MGRRHNRPSATRRTDAGRAHGPCWGHTEISSTFADLDKSQATVGGTSGDQWAKRKKLAKDLIIEESKHQALWCCGAGRPGSDEEATSVNLEFLRPLYDEVGAYVSVYLGTDPASEDAAEATGLRWRAAREELAAAGASPATLDAVGAAIEGGGPARGRAVFAR